MVRPSIPSLWRTWVKTLYPAYFASVMATGIVCFDFDTRK